MRKLVIVVLILIAIPVVWYRWNFPTVSYRYRLTVAVEVDGQVHSGSSVIEVQYSFNPKWVPPSWGVYNEYVWGQAVLIDLGARGALVAALAGQNYDHISVRAGDLAGRAYQPEAVDLNGYLPTPERVRALSRMQGRVDLASNNLPAFLWFSNPADLATAKLVRPADFASVIGDSARLVSAQVEMTRDPLVFDLDKRLPIYAALRGPPNNGNDYTAPGGLTLGWRQLISRGTE
jgi:hypothetical protein